MGGLMGEHQVNTTDLRALGARIREARESTGWTQQELADHLGMSRTTIIAIEKGERRLKPAELVQLASLLGRNVSDLLQRSAPAEAFGVQLRSTLPSSGTPSTPLPRHIEDFQHLCEDYVRLEELCQ